MQTRNPDDQARKYLDLCLIFRMFPLDSIDTSLWFTETQSVRQRSMTPQVIICFVILRWLHQGASDEEILRHIFRGFEWLGLRGRSSTGEEMGKSGLSQARTRLGWKPFELPAIDICRPIHSSMSNAAKLRQWQGVSLDSTTFKVDRRTLSTFGQQSKKKRPEIRLAALIEHGTNVMFGANMGGVVEDERNIAGDCLLALNDTMVCLGDASIFGYGMYKAALAKGAQLIWRVPDTLYLPHAMGLPDGTYLSDLFKRREQCRVHLDAVVVRVIEFSTPGQPPGQFTRLITTLLDHRTAPAQEIAAFFQSRRTIKTALESSRIKAPGREVKIAARPPIWCGRMSTGFSWRIFWSAR